MHIDRGIFIDVKASYRLLLRLGFGEKFGFAGKECCLCTKTVFSTDMAIYSFLLTDHVCGAVKP